MSDHSPVAQAFVAWAHSETASHYASPCPDDVMTHLTDRTFDDLEALFALPSDSPHDVLLKTFVLLVSKYEPSLGDAPLTPKLDERYDGRLSELGLPSVLSDMRRLAPLIAKALAVQSSAWSVARAAELEQHS